MKKQQIGIFSGSFNPIHIGHLILANYLCEFTYLDEVWFVVSPQNPFKNAAHLLDDAIRLEMARLALEDFEYMKVSDIEFQMPRPSYTIDTLTKLTQKHTDVDFTLIIGGDNWKEFHRWKEAEQLLKEYSILIYPRLNEEVVIPEQLRTTVQLVEAPVVEISSTFIRQSILEGKNVRAFLPPKVYDFIEQQRLYRI